MSEYEYAGFWIRVGASLIDAIIMVIVFFIPLMFIYGQDILTGTQMIRGFWDIVLSYVLPTVATIWFWLRFFGTPGKMALRLKIVDAKTGNRLSLGQAVVRYLSYIPAIMFFFLGIIWVGIDKKKQGWHDKLAGTVVIRTNQPEPVRFES